MELFYDQLIVRAASIDELLSDEFESLPGQKGDTDAAARRLAAWCRSCASGDWGLFGRRLLRDGLSIGGVLERFATVRRRASAAVPAWIDDAIWIEAALRATGNADSGSGLVSSTPWPDPNEPCAFQHLFLPVVAHADALLWSDIAPSTATHLTASARAGLGMSLLRQLSGLCAPALYERFAKARQAIAPSNAARPGDIATARYDQFVAEMKTGGWRRLFEDKPVLLRLMASITRQWIDTSRELVIRLAADMASIRRDILATSATSRVATIEGDLSDAHHGGRSVQILRFEDGTHAVYKPKDMRLDAAWHELIERLNRAHPPIDLRAARAIARDGYGWSEFIDHAAGTNRDGGERFFRRAGAWLALFHYFAASDMHQENIIAAGDHPVPIDLEMILQPAAAQDEAETPESQAFNAAVETVANSVMMVGLLPAYGRSPDNKVFSIGGLSADWNTKIVLTWTDINSDAMRPAKSKRAGTPNPNLPHIDGRYARSADHIGAFVSGFKDYAAFLVNASGAAGTQGLLDGFAGLTVRKLIRPTRFYAMLLQRLKDHRTMDDGVAWSAQADFVARLAEWEKDADPQWPLQRSERSALLALNVPHFVSPTDSDEIGDGTGFAIRTAATPGMQRALARMQCFDQREIAWQVEVIRQNTNAMARTAAPVAADEGGPAGHAESGVEPSSQFIAEADRIAAEISRHAIRRGQGAAWIGLDWLGDAEVFQLACLGPDLYNGVSGIAVYLAAHAAVRTNAASRELALAAVAHLRSNLKSRHAARMARAIGVGGATGLGSIIYALAVMSKSLHDDALLDDAGRAAALFTDDLIAADKQLDAIGGSAGAILGLLRLHRDTDSGDVLRCAIRCGEHLLGQSRLGPQGQRSWVGQGFGSQPLNGMSHGAAGFAYALASLSVVTGREDFAAAASECIAFENSSYDPARHNWPDLRSGGEPGWPCQWCHGAAGIGLARLGTHARGGADAKLLSGDIRHAVEGVKHGWRGQVDTLCCGALGNIEFFCEAARTLGRSDLRELASQQLASVLENAVATGDYRWNSGNRQFNLGLFRGLAGVGYTLLRQVDGSLPNVTIWE